MEIHGNEKKYNGNEWKYNDNKNIMIINDK